MRILAALLAGIAISLGGIQITNGHHPAPADTPIHAVHVFFDGINHADYRQTCSVWQASGAKQQGTMASCERYLIGAIGFQMMLNGGFPHYSVVPNSQQEWEQPYRGHSVRLAIVTVIGPQGEMAAHLRKIGHGWKVWYVG